MWQLANHLSVWKLIALMILLLLSNTAKLAVFAERVLDPLMSVVTTLNKRER